LCTVRNCGAALLRESGRVFCPKGHSFDIARCGYINLLQPQDRRSRNPGDTRAAVLARRNIHDLGVTEPILRQISGLLLPSSGEVVLDVGSGDGFYLGSLARQYRLEAHGIDISLPAVDIAAKRYPACHWVVANADRFVPYANQSVSRMLSLTARMNCDEFHRVLRSDGNLLVAVPSPDDLIELRGTGHDRTTRTIENFAAKFKLLDRQRATCTAELDALAMQNVLLSIYRPRQASPPTAGKVTFSLDLLLFQPAKN
jgi:23S rRNA (guanine745-N1)-methyltransferase